MVDDRAPGYVDRRLSSSGRHCAELEPDPSADRPSSPPKSPPAPSREEREAQALRDNLRRRKEQARARRTRVDTPDPA